jgi:nitric oxide reductase large subunit
MFSSGVTGTGNHWYWIEDGAATLSDGASGASLVSRFGRSLKR